MSTIVLVQCVSKKLDGPCPAKDLYISPLFKKIKALVENSNSDWFILSAKHHLLSPSEIIENYDKTLNNMKVSDRNSWAVTVIQQMEQELPEADRVVIFAGEKYRNSLMNYLCDRYKQVLVPMAGLGIGKQLEWLDNAKSICG